MLSLLVLSCSLSLFGGLLVFAVELDNVTSERNWSNRQRERIRDLVDSL